jgi:ethanolaminephosphotransferase
VISEKDGIQILWRNARQILNVVTAAFPSFENGGSSTNCSDLGDDVERLACEWRIISASLPGPKDNTQSTERWASNTLKVLLTLKNW